MESLLLRIAKPKGNKVNGKFYQCQNCVFRRDIRTEQREQIDSLFRRTRDEEPAEVHHKRRPAMALYVNRRTKRRSRSKKRYRAMIRKNGPIRFGSRTFNSPSLAATAVTGRPMNG